MNSEKVKEIKKGLEEYIRQYSNFKGSELCKEALTLINELEKENAKLLNSVETVQSNRCTTKCELTKKQLKQFAERLMNYDEFLLHADEQGRLFYVDFTAWLDETLKEFINADK